MNFKNLIVCISLIFLFSSAKNKDKSIALEMFKAEPPSLEFLWKTKPVLTTSESVLYHKESGVIYVSNINKNSSQKGNNGFISTINIDGEITNLKWIEGLNGPKGMAIYNGKLYVNDIDDLVEIDIKTQKILNKYNVKGSPKLNDLTVSEEGIIYASGSASNTVYKLEGGALKVFAKGSLAMLNGLLVQKEGIYYLDSKNNNFGLLNIDNKKYKTLTKNIGLGDGIIRLENGDFITSNWKGEIYYIYAKNWSKVMLLDTKAESINAADICFIPETQMLLVPTFFDNSVACYRLKL